MVGLNILKIRENTNFSIRQDLKQKKKPTFLEFFAGSGLVTEGLRPYFNAVWANDISQKKSAVYIANHGNKNFKLGSVSDVRGTTLPKATLSWASFPCQDLSLAGLTAGIYAKRSGLVWQWLKVMDEMPIKPPLLVAENVAGLISSDGGSYYRALHKALYERGYNVGAVVLDAVRWVPQSRLRVFVIAVKKKATISEMLIDKGPNWMHPRLYVDVAKNLDGLIWWKMPEPQKQKKTLAELIEWEAQCDSPEATQKKLSLISSHHFDRLKQSELCVAPGYKRTRNKKQVLELRFDGIAGCLRTAQGGSSRQVVVLKRNSEFLTRLLTVREVARLMGAPESYKIPGSYNDGYTAMGDAVAVPVTRYLAHHLLSPLAKAIDE